MQKDTSSNKSLIYDLSYDGLKEKITSLNQPAYRAMQIWDGLYKQLWNNSDEFSSLSKDLRNIIATEINFSSLKPKKTLESLDHETIKTLFTLPDGNPVESVLMTYHNRCSLCISSQSGCPINCTFCATGQMGYKRNLSCGEIIEQVIFFAKQLKNKGKKLTNIVIMGMGEPFLNYEQTMLSIDILNHPQGFNMGERRFTISTVGIIPLIERFSQEKRQINLAISLHAANNQLRTTLMPINQKYPLDDLIVTCRKYIDNTHRRLTFEWALIDGVNDSSQNAHELVNLLHGMLCHVNLIPLNPTHKYIGKSSSKQNFQSFYQIIQNSGIPCSIRLRRGIDIQAGCGQLASDQI